MKKKKKTQHGTWEHNSRVEVSAAHYSARLSNKRTQEHLCTLIITDSERNKSYARCVLDYSSTVPVRRDRQRFSYIGFFLYSI